MTENQTNQTSESMEVLSKLTELLEKNIVVMQIVAPPVIAEITATVNPQERTTDNPIEELPIDETVDIPITTEKTKEKSTKGSVKNPDIKDIAENIAGILSLLEVSNRKDEINKELHEELQSYKSGLRREILSSVLKDIIRWHGKVSDQYSFYNNKMQEENADIATLFPTLLNEYKNLADGLEDLLYDYDIEADKPKEGEDYNPRSQKKIGTIATENEEKDNRVAKCVSIGFRDTKTDRLILQPEVVVYQKKVEL